jgi:hypothetical protein
MEIDVESPMKLHAQRSPVECYEWNIHFVVWHGVAMFVSRITIIAVPIVETLFVAVL